MTTTMDPAILGTGDEEDPPSLFWLTHMTKANSSIAELDLGESRAE